MSGSDPSATGATQVGGGPSTGADGDLRGGTQVGEYLIERVLGRGGFGTVYLATHPLIGKRVAVKVLSRRYSADGDMVSRFVAEAKAVNQIKNRHIIDIFAFGTLEDGRHYYVMEYLDGQPLDGYLDEHGALSLDAALPILRPVARALAAAHAKGVAHRDLKSENIFLAQDDEGTLHPKLLDFGIAKLSGPDDQLAHKTGTGVPLGTPYYMSPEQCRGRGVDHRTDIYSFGVLAYRVLTGRFPFDGELIEILHKQMHEDPAPPNISPQVDAAILWMLRKNSDERPQSILEAMSSLAPGATSSAPVMVPLGITGNMPSASTTGRPGELPAAPMSTIEAPRRSRLPTILVLGVVGLVAAIAAYVLVSGSKHDGPVDRAVPVASAALDAPVAPDAAVAADASPPVLDAAAPVDAVVLPTRVILTITGAPSGTTVSIDGQRIGVAPTVAVPYSSSAVTLVLTARGYKPATHSVLPDADQVVKVKLEKKKQAGYDRDAIEEFP